MGFSTQSPVLPSLHSLLPDLFHFAQGLAWEYQCGRLAAEDLHRTIVEFFTPGEMNKIEKTIPGWNEMAGYARGQTLVHTVCMLLAMIGSDEYARANDEEKLLLEWIAVLHDLGKQATERQRDHAHAFRSAALAAKILPKIGFPVQEGYERLVGRWSGMVSRAVVIKEEYVLQDNTNLADILSGIDKMFGLESSTAKVVQCILLHMSLDTVPDEWPCPAGLDDRTARQLIRQELVPLLTAVMLADSDAWNLYNLEVKERYRKMTLDYVEKVWPNFKNAGLSFSKIDKIMDN